MAKKSRAARTPPPGRVTTRELLNRVDMILSDLYDLDGDIPWDWEVSYLLREMTAQAAARLRESILKGY